MKIVTWNCNGALRKKFKQLSGLHADIFVIQECENPAESKDKEYKAWAENHLWMGDTKNKGLGIFTKKNIALKKLDWANVYKDHNVKHFLPCSVNEEFELLLAVWTHRNNSPNFGYMGQQQGKESQPTFFLHRSLNKPYHMDYCFASSIFFERLKNVTVESYENWKRLSDHSPLIITFEE